MWVDVWVMEFGVSDSKVELVSIFYFLGEMGNGVEEGRCGLRESVLGGGGGEGC